MAGGHLAPGGRPGCGGGAGPACAPHAPPRQPPAPLPPRPGKRPRPALYLAVLGAGAASQRPSRSSGRAPGGTHAPPPLSPGGRGGTGARVSMAIASRPGGAAMTRRGRPPLRPAQEDFPAPPTALRPPHRPPRLGPAGAGAAHLPFRRRRGPRRRRRRRVGPRARWRRALARGGGRRSHPSACAR